MRSLVASLQSLRTTKNTQTSRILSILGSGLETVNTQRVTHTQQHEQVFQYTFVLFNTRQSCKQPRIFTRISKHDYNDTSEVLKSFVMEP